MRGQPGFFDVDDRLQRLTDLGDQLLAFTKVVDFEAFRPELTKALAYSDGGAGRTAAVRSCDDVQGAGDPGRQQSPMSARSF